MRNPSGMRLSGVVLEVRGRQAVVLAGGRFLRLRSVAGWEPGQEVWLASSPLEAAERFRRRLTTAATAAGAAAVVVVSGGAVAAAVPVAVVSVDLTPGVQLSVNHWARVLDASALDPSGRRLLRRVGRLDHLPVSTAVSDLVRGAAALGYLHPVAAAGGAAPGATVPTPGGSAGPAKGAASGRRQATPASRGGEAGPAGPATVLIAMAPVRGHRDAVPTDIQRQVASAARDAQALLAGGGARSPVVAVGRGRAADVRAASREGVTLGEYMLAKDLAAEGARLGPQAFSGKAIDAVLARSGVTRAALQGALRAMESGAGGPLARAFGGAVPAAAQHGTPASLAGSGQGQPGGETPTGHGRPASTGSGKGRTAGETPAGHGRPASVGSGQGQSAGETPAGHGRGASSVAHGGTTQGQAPVDENVSHGPVGVPGTAAPGQHASAASAHGAGQGRSQVGTGLPQPKNGVSVESPQRGGTSTASTPGHANGHGRATALSPAATSVSPAATATAAPPVPTGTLSGGARSEGRRGSPSSTTAAPRSGGKGNASRAVPGRSSALHAATGGSTAPVDTATGGSVSGRKGGKAASPVRPHAAASSGASGRWTGIRLPSWLRPLTQPLLRQSTPARGASSPATKSGGGAATASQPSRTAGSSGHAHASGARHVSGRPATAAGSAGARTATHSAGAGALPAAHGKRTGTATGARTGVPAQTAPTRSAKPVGGRGRIAVR